MPMRLVSLRNLVRATYQRLPTAGLLAAVPYLLLSASQSVKLTTVVNWDGSGLREYTISCLKDRIPDARKRLREKTDQFDRESPPRGSGAQVLITRSWRPASIASLPDTALHSTDLVRDPVNIFTTYGWSERLEIYRETATEVETEGEGKAVLQYVLKMPGRVRQASAGGQINGHTVTWELSGEQEEYTLEATSRRVRWEMLLILVYVLGFIVFQVGSYAARILRYRPRKI